MLKEINISKSWDEVSLKQYQELEKLFLRNEMYDYRNIVSILSNKTIEEINELPFEIFDILIGYTSFLSEKPNEKESRNEIIIDGNRYSIDIMEKLKVGEYTDVMMVIEQDKHNYAAILAILCRKDNERYDDEFISNKFNDRLTMFEKQRITDIFPLISFFLLLSQLSDKHFQNYLKQKVEENQNVVNGENSHKHTHGRKYSMMWQKIKSKMWRKSKDNT